MDHTKSNLTWSALKDAVQPLLLRDGKRLGAEDYREATIRQAVIQLQGAIEQYRVNHETIYTLDDLVLEGKAYRGVKPPQSVIKDVFFGKYDEDDAEYLRWPTRYWNWNDRFALVHGDIPVNDGKGIISIDPQGYTFYAYPENIDLISIHWDGLKLDFRDDEETPFDEATAGAVAEFVMAKMARIVDHDIPLHDSYMRSFELAVRRCWVRERDKAQPK